MLTFAQSPLTEIKHRILENSSIQLFLKREELLHPHLQGNKWRKLKYNLEAAKNEKHDTLLTFGGAHSNHIYATAAAGRLFGFKTIGIIRGERIEPLNKSLNQTLEFAEQNGMLLQYISRSDYRLKSTEAFENQLLEKFGPCYILPEGGSNALALQGVAELADELPDGCDFLAVACGTGATAAGLCLGAHLYQKKYQLLPFSVLKNGEFLNQEINHFLTEYSTFTTKNQRLNPKNAVFDLQTAYHFGGYAKNKPALQTFIDEWHHETAIRIEHVYTAKMLYGLFDLIKKDYFPKGAKIIAIHTGGLRGARILF
jgi:1-aminocyclopropane-1-carboxylate deaminase/D-cysteine desulfhydrase-like pyridoxal-dependent ACC family enzyme